MIPGREEDVGWSGKGVGTKLGISLEGARAADWAALKRTLLMAL